MKTATIFFLVCTLFLFSGCSDDDAPAPVFSVEFLYQTAWEGTYTKKSYDEIASGPFNIVFNTDREGRYEGKIDGGRPFSDPFLYTIKGKMLTLSGNYYFTLEYDWFVQEITPDRLVLVHGIEDKNVNSTLTLRKVY